MTKKKEVDPVVAAMWRQDDQRRAEEYDRTHKVLCNPVDAEAGTIPLWPFNYTVAIAAHTNQGEQRRTYPVNAGSQWEACIFAERRLRGELRSTHVVGPVRIIELQPL